MILLPLLAHILGPVIPVADYNYVALSLAHLRVKDGPPPSGDEVYAIVVYNDGLGHVGLNRYPQASGQPGDKEKGTAWGITSSSKDGNNDFSGRFSLGEYPTPYNKK